MQDYRNMIDIVFDKQSKTYTIFDNPVIMNFKPKFVKV